MRRVDTASGPRRLARALAAYRRGLADGLAPSCAVGAAYRAWTDSLERGIPDARGRGDTEAMESPEQSRPRGADIDTAQAEVPPRETRASSYDATARSTLLGESDGRAPSGATETLTLRAPRSAVHASAVYGASPLTSGTSAAVLAERTYVGRAAGMDRPDPDLASRVSRVLFRETRAATDALPLAAAIRATCERGDADAIRSENLRGALRALRSRA